MTPLYNRYKEEKEEEKKEEKDIGPLTGTCGRPDDRPRTSGDKSISRKEMDEISKAKVPEIWMLEKLSRCFGYNIDEKLFLWIFTQYRWTFRPELRDDWREAFADSGAWRERFFLRLLCTDEYSSFAKATKAARWSAITVTKWRNGKPNFRALTDSIRNREDWEAWMRGDHGI